MNLINGEFIDDREALSRLDELPSLVLASRCAAPLPREAVIRAADAVSRALNEREHLPLLTALGMTREKALKELNYARFVTSREYLSSRLIREFGGTEDGRFTPYGGETPVRMQWQPLGVLLHISAGNVDAMPVFSVLEGLLTGNINILKLPGGDNGLSALILKKLIAAEPRIAQYVYMFDFPSSDIRSIQKLASAADAIVVWGGDEAVRAVRSLAEPNVRIIEWGHKLSFAYVSWLQSDSALEGIAENIAYTEQLYCNSCQGIFLDTDDFEAVSNFAEYFACVLERVCARMPRVENDRLTAQKTLELYTEELEAEPDKRRIFKKSGCSVIAYSSSELTPSHMFRSCWVRPLPREQLISTLAPYKSYLNTAALICPAEDRAQLEGLLTRAGIVRITSGRRMSESFCGAPHDGELPLRRYMKLVTYEY